MTTEVFVQPNGDITSAWDIEFTDVMERQEFVPCDIHQLDGSVGRGRMRIKVETSRVGFCVAPDVLQVGLQGQLSANDDTFHHVLITSLEKKQNHEWASGQSSRMISSELE